MTEAVFALIGIVIGAVLSGTVQLFIARRERISRGRTAARVLFGETVTLSNALNWAVDNDDWWQEALSFERWATYRDALAAYLPSELFYAVAGVFFEAERDEQSRVAGADPAVMKERWERTARPVLRAQTILYRASLTWAERRRQQISRMSKLREQLSLLEERENANVET